MAEFLTITTYCSLSAHTCISEKKTRNYGNESAYEKRSTLPVKSPPVFGHFWMYRIYELTFADYFGLLEALLQ